MSIWTEADVARRVERLRESPSPARVFGYMGHHFELGPELEQNEIEEFERSEGISLREPYRSFLSDVGNGGAGPGYGIFPLGSHGETARITVPWVPENDLPSRPFPHEHPWNFPREELLPPDDLLEDELRTWILDREARIWAPGRIDGTLPIGHLGCAMWVLLVVTGTAPGEVWIDDRASDQGIHPNDICEFDEWYLSWLVAAESVI